MHKQRILAVSLGIALMAPVAAFASQPTVWGYGQVLAGQNTDMTAAKGMGFSLNRIRLGVKGNATSDISYLFQYSFDKGNSGVIRDAAVGLNMLPFAELEVGQFKTPVGQEFQVSGAKLQFINRNMGTNLLPQRDIGLMVHNKNGSGYGLNYALGLFNNANVSDTNAKVLVGDAYQYPDTGAQTPGGSVPGKYLVAARVGYGMGKMMNFEVSGDEQAVNNAASPGSPSDILTWDAGLAGNMAGAEYGLEYVRTIHPFIGTTSFTGTPPVPGIATGGFLSTPASDWYVYAGYKLMRRIEPVIRFDRLEADGSVDNTTLGVNYDFTTRKAYPTKLQVNYIIPSSNKTTAVDQALPGVYTSHTLQVELQVGF
ncbi:MAG: porin [Acidiferrobacteraceae bacterium]